MNKKKIIAVVFAALLAMTGLVGCTTPQQGGEAKFDAAKYPEWLENEALWRTVATTAFKAGVENAPSDEELKTIMRMVSLTPTSGGMTDYLWVVLKDPAQQQDVVGEGKAGDGTITLLLFADRLFSPEESIHDHEQQIDRGYFTSGMTSGYLNLAALSLGYGTHWYLTTEYTKDNWEAGRSQSAEDTYLKDKGYRYTFGNPGYRNRNYERDENDAAEAYGNLKFVTAVVIGTLDETAETKLTDRNYPENWVIAQ